MSPCCTLFRNALFLIVETLDLLFLKDFTFAELFFHLSVVTVSVACITYRRGKQ